MLRFGVTRAHGGSSLTESARSFTAVLGTLARERVQLVVARDYDHLLQGALSGGIDVAWMPPLVHARATPLGALLAAVSERAGAVTYRSALLTRADSPYLNVRSLHGARAAWSDPSSAGGYLFAYLHLLAQGIDRRELKSEQFVGSPLAACTAVADGAADVCACYVTEAAVSDGAVDRARALVDVARVFPRAQERLRVLDVTDSIPPDGVVLAPLLDGARQARLRDLLLTLHQREGGAPALATLMQADRLAPVTETVRKTIARLMARVVER
jgi:ABC-type phosphate/phosphonate transport system substrate-binding protein